MIESTEAEVAEAELQARIKYDDDLCRNIRPDQYVAFWRDLIWQTAKVVEVHNPRMLTLQPLNRYGGDPVGPVIQKVYRYQVGSKQRKHNCWSPTI